MSKIVIDETGNRHVFPDDATDSEINAQIGPPKKYSGFTPDIFKSSPYTAFLANDQARAALPSVGAFAGGVVGGIPGAAGGGAIGEGIRQAASGEKIDPLGIAGQGALQGGLEAAGGLIAKGVGAAAKPVMRSAIRASAKLQKAFPDIAETALANGLSVGKGGLAKATALRRSSAKATRALLEEAKASGTTFNPSDVVAQVYEKLKNPALPNEDAAIISRQLENFLEQHSGEIDPVLLQQIKQVYQNRATPMYAAAAGGRAEIGMGPQGVFNKALAGGAREQLGTIPGVAAQDANTQSLIGAERAIQAATLRHAPQPELLKPLTYPIVGALGHSGVTSRAALLMNNVRFLELLRQSPRAAVALFQQAQADATSGR